VTARRRRSLAESIAGVIAILVMTGSAGWLTATMVAWPQLPNTAPVLVMLLGTIAGAIAYVIAIRVLTGVLAPMTVLARDARSVADTPRDHISQYRDCIRRLPKAARSTEIDDLVAAIDQLLARIERRHERQAAWTGAVAHDLKTPVAACANVLAVWLHRSKESSGTDMALIEGVERELRDLVIAIQRMLDAVRFERDDLPLQRSRVDLANLIGRIAERQAGELNVRVEWRGTGSVEGDAVLLERALDNLVSNAVRYARAAVTIEIFPGMVRIADDGTGLPSPLEHLTQPFRSEPVTVEGLDVSVGAGGIGLFVASRVLDLHGGRLAVESTGPAGTVFLAYMGSSRGR